MVNPSLYLALLEKRAAAEAAAVEAEPARKRRE